MGRDATAAVSPHDRRKVLDEAVEQGGFLKFPLELLSEDVLAAGAPSPQVVDAGIVAGAILQQYELRGYSPTLRKLQQLTGRGRARVLAAVEQLVAAGWLSARKVKWEFGAEFGWKWRFTIPTSSPLMKLTKAQRSGRSGRRFIMLPASIARSKSSILAGAFLVLHEVARRDRVVVFTPGRLARLLNCHRSTAHRLLERMGATKLATTEDGMFVYHVAGVSRSVGDDARSRWGRRLAELSHAMGASFEPYMQDAARDLSAAGIDVAERPDLLVRLLEETHLHALMAHDETRKSIMATLSWRVRLSGRRLAGRSMPERAPSVREASTLAAAIETATCSCDDGYVLQETTGGLVAAPCPRCRT